MALQGSLRTMPADDLLDWLDRRFACGVLTVTWGPVERAFHLDSGYVTQVSSNLPGERLGLLLVSRGLVTEEQLYEAFQAQGDTGVRLGKVLIMVGAVDRDGLKGALEDKIREAVCEVLSWRDGAFSFEDEAGGEEAASEFSVSVNLRTALEEGRDQVEERRAVRERISSEEQRFYVADRDVAVRPEDGEERRELLERLVACAGRGLSAGQIILEGYGDRFRVLRGLSELLERGAIAPERRSRPRAPPEAQETEELAGAARGRAAGGDRIGALALAKRALERDPQDPGAQELHRELERKVFAELSRDLLADFRVPKLLKSRDELAELQLSDAERYLAGRIDGRWDLLSLMRLSPLREVEALITFRRLADRGIISL